MPQSSAEPMDNHMEAQSDMTAFDPIRYKAATAVFRLGVKANGSGVHRTLNRPPKGKGWIPCATGPEGLMCRPEKVRESIEYFRIAYEVFPDIVALNQIALSYEMLGEKERARESFEKMREQARSEGNEAYVRAAEMGLSRTA